MQLFLEHLGVAVAAITGILAAKGKQIDLFGVLVLALVTAFGGGTLRDAMLGVRPFWIADPRYLWTATAAAIAWFFAARVWRFPRTVLLVADAYALALFTIVGVMKSLALGFPASIAVGMGVITGVAGGIMRDVLIGEIPLVFRPHIHLYATAAILGSVAYVLLARWVPASPTYNMVLGVAVVFILRVAGIHWRIGLPVFLAEAGDAVRDAESQ